MRDQYGSLLPFWCSCCVTHYILALPKKKDNLTDVTICSLRDLLYLLLYSANVYQLAGKTPTDMSSWQCSEGKLTHILRDSIEKKNATVQIIHKALQARCDWGNGKGYTYDSLSMPLNTDDALTVHIREVLDTDKVYTYLKRGARPLRVDDYEELGRKCGYIFKGVPAASSTNLDSRTIPPTFFHSTANWAPAVAESTVQTESAENKEATSYTQV